MVVCCCCCFRTIEVSVLSFFSDRSSRFDGSFALACFHSFSCSFSGFFLLISLALALGLTYSLDSSRRCCWLVDKALRLLLLLLNSSSFFVSLFCDFCDSHSFVSSSLSTADCRLFFNHFNVASLCYSRDSSSSFFGGTLSKSINLSPVSTSSAVKLISFISC
jgi:hypothetical protein